MKISIATRQSKLALVQTESIRSALQALEPKADMTLLKITTEGDRFLQAPLYKVGGKALFTKELDQALLEGKADLAVHSLKDLPADLPAGLTIAAICEREDPRDAFVSHQYADIAMLPVNARVGTSSLRRQCQIKALRPDLNIVPLRGNVDSRIDKINRGEFDAIILASAGLKRLSLTHWIHCYLAPEICLPAAGQGALCIVCRSTDQALLSLLQQLDHYPSRTAVTAERAVNRFLNGGCQVPIAGYATVQGDTLWLRALVGSSDGSLLIRSETSGSTQQAENLGLWVAKDLLAQGADTILHSCHSP